MVPIVIKLPDLNERSERPMRLLYQSTKAEGRLSIYPLNMCGRYSIITGAPNTEMTPIHDRMPMLLTNEATQSQWLDRNLPLPDVLDLLHTPPDGTLEYYPVGAMVGNVRNNGPELHERISR